MMEDYIICQICGEKVSRIYGAHLKKHGMTSQEYKDKYPGCPLMCEKDLKNTIKNSGKHMQTEKYKKIFSDKMKGEKNPNHKSKTTLEERKKRSPFCLEFHNDEEELIEFRNNALANREFAVRLDYYLDRGYDLETSEKMLKERQSTFSLDICIDKYGEIEGTAKFKERTAKWQKSLLENGNLKCGYSKISQELFYSILDYYNFEDRSDIYFATKNKEYFISMKGGIFYQYDFTDLKNKKIIEYNGDDYHANPKKYESNDTPHPFRKNITSEEIWKKDNDKKEIAELNGFEVLTIWDIEYKKEKQKTIEKCLMFLNKFF
jgi:hypothetical protein